MEEEQRAHDHTHACQKQASFGKDSHVMVGSADVTQFDRFWQCGGGAKCDTRVRSYKGASYAAVFWERIYIAWLEVPT